MPGVLDDSEKALSWEWPPRDDGSGEMKQYSSWVGVGWAEQVGDGGEPCEHGETSSIPVGKGGLFFPVSAGVVQAFSQTFQVGEATQHRRCDSGSDMRRRGDFARCGEVQRFDDMESLRNGDLISCGDVSPTIENGELNPAVESSCVKNCLLHPSVWNSSSCEICPGFLLLQI